MTGPAALRPGSRVGRFEVLELLGSGGMGDVFRAHDRRLGRDVALKVLKEGQASDQEALRAIEREARAASALSHPRLITVFEVDTEATPPYLAMELAEGPTLAALAHRGALPPARALALVAQVADGLAAAHEEGLVHRDLKPANVVVTKGDAVKVLDFGLARRPAALVSSPSDTTVAAGPSTEPGTVLGTAGYMSPEQATGQSAGFPSDQFSLGVILYELLTGRRAFARPTVVESLAAIVREEPEPLPPIAPALDAPLGWVLARCLAKDPEQRYGSTRDLARDLAELAALAGGTHAGPAGSGGRTRGSGALRRWGLSRTLGAAAVIAGAAAGLGGWAARSQRPPSLPVFQQLTFRRGALLSARFTPGGEEVLYGAAWDGAPVRTFRVRVEGGTSAQVVERDANLLAVSPSGELALALDASCELPSMTSGTLALSPLSGGAPREVLERVEFADFGGTGGEPVVVRRQDGRVRLEGPGGRVLHETAGWISHPRTSPDGTLVAFIHHPVFPDDRGEVLVVPIAGGAARSLSGGPWSSVLGLAWAPGGREVWFSATGKLGARALEAADLAGRVRTLYRMAGNLTLHDVSPSGRVLVAHDTMRIGLVRGRSGGEERDESWLDSSLMTDLSSDGRSLLFTEFGEGGGTRYSAYLRRADGSQAVRLGEGLATALSPDGRRVLALLPADPPRLTVLPTGAGKSEPVKTAPVVLVEWATWFPDGRRILLIGSEPDRGMRLWRLDGVDGPARPLTAEGVTAAIMGGSVSPDGRTVAVATEKGGVLVVPSEGGESSTLGPEAAGLVPVRWVEDGRALLAFVREGPSARLLRLDAGTGSASPVREMRPADGAGVIGISTVRTTADGSTWVYSYGRLLSELYLVDGLR